MFWRCSAKLFCTIIGFESHDRLREKAFYGWTTTEAVSLPTHLRCSDAIRCLGSSIKRTQDFEFWGELRIACEFLYI